MRRGCQLQFFGEAQGPVRDNQDDAEADAIRLKLGRVDQHGRLFLDAGAELVWRPVPERPALRVAQGAGQPSQRARA
jgi:hypothetical protein